MLACRDLEKAEEAASEISLDTGNKVTILKLNLASLKSVRGAAKELKQRHPKIHILVNNAGTVMYQDSRIYALRVNSCYVLL